MAIRLEYNVQGTLEDGRKYVDPEMWFTFQYLPKMLRLVEDLRQKHPEAEMSFICRWRFHG